MTDANADTTLTRLVVVGSYPGVLATGFAVYAALVGSGWQVTAASWVAVITGAALVTLHEARLPYRREWHPTGSDVRADGTFLATVQAVLPLLFSVTVVVAIADLLDAGGLAVEGLWPHGFPIAAQVVLMIAAADFPRYWLHRAFHRFLPMWRLHAVHHSPHRLYWLNVGRFHPIEKAVQYTVDTLPFALVGVPPEVLAAYFVFYALNGFFQHSNCRVRLGPLNYVVSGPELHRWHHSEVTVESDNNFGNNLIVWDVLFGTRFLPADREVGPLGLHNREYPLGFLAQMRTPFIAGLER
ncbi:MAG: sterol desaturase family protein [Chloroflexi bacterium]|nr:sterol desaturase family protein [Chloroflexota bacterium]